MIAGVDATLWKSVPQGAATEVFVAASPLVGGVTGRFFGDSSESVVSKEMTGLAPHAADPEAAARLWELSQAWLNAR